MGLHSHAAKGWATEELDLNSRQRKEISFLSAASVPALGSAQPPVERVPEVLFSGVKLPGLEAGY
jgi:hypothetical protein